MVTADCRVGAEDGLLDGGAKMAPMGAEGRVIRLEYAETQTLPSECGALLGELALCFERSDASGS